jgi:hypothetical protein
MALHQLICVEKAPDQQKTALCVFLDTERAFNNTSYDSMCAAFFKRVVNYTIVWWMRVILESCLAAATLSGYS